MASSLNPTGFLDSMAKRLEVQVFPVELTHNVQAVLPVNPSSVATKRIYGVLIVDDEGQELKKIIASSWDIDGSLRPRITALFAAGSGTMNCTVAVFWKR